MFILLNGLYIFVLFLILAIRSGTWIYYIGKTSQNSIDIEVLQTLLKTKAIGSSTR